MHAEKAKITLNMCNKRNNMCIIGIDETREIILRSYMIISIVLVKFDGIGKFVLVRSTLLGGIGRNGESTKRGYS
jgi:hypothetical protein